MSRRRFPAPAKLVVSAIFREEDVFGAAMPRVADIVGEVRCAGRLYPFDATAYYSGEMGEPLFRRFLVASTPVSRDSLPEIKVGLEEIERELSKEGRRTVNLDPGLITPENFILGTGKNFTHRVYLRDGVFADLTLIFRKGDFRTLPWTYSDYASDEIRSFLRELRLEHLNSLGHPESPP